MTEIYDFTSSDYLIHHGSETRGPFRGRVATMAAAEGWQTALGGDDTIEVEFCTTRQIIASLHTNGWCDYTIKSADGEIKLDWTMIDD
ncbi:MAG: hypothetical protein QGG09_22365 [Pirellulaceae bacterium]|jgi:hypothetical protein|nr:hypothetical protein [Pirellulaceae bacterium]HJN11962.1 hypothetical protein [Pirellulaceae bacterium]